MFLKIKKRKNFNSIYWNNRSMTFIGTNILYGQLSSVRSFIRAHLFHPRGYSTPRVSEMSSYDRFIYNIIYTHTKSTACMFPTIMPYIQLIASTYKFTFSPRGFFCILNIEAGHVESNWTEFIILFHLYFLFKLSSSFS